MVIRKSSRQPMVPVTDKYPNSCITLVEATLTLIVQTKNRAAVAEFRLLTGRDCLCVRFTVAPFRDSGQVMDAAHFNACSTLKNLECIVRKYWRARGLMT
ncbi:hypothetical protein TNCV_4831341 [Trichonephila clavipes]|nr:hypothetical protein TNCV_4831341 [Trichonephila clavipes]